ncbi:Kinase, NEK [Giardia muris]|uniref:Kinase, NEK n=1 Tax=Giardia muris TaxID=5742 RepID=A0A4Z1T3R3_GIAMU|nr:Kinase, NEK [Giardia muris]|eukprot:TNJ30288.1 Kinase, NEK [Giardia muris]
MPSLALIEAVKNDDTTSFARHMSHLEVYDDHKMTALMWATQLGRLHFVHELLTLAREQSDNGRTALMYAAEHGHVECVRALRERESGMCDENGWTALMWAVRGKHKECANLLLSEAPLRSTKELLSLEGKSFPKGVSALDIANTVGIEVEGLSPPKQVITLNVSLTSELSYADLRKAVKKNDIGFIHANLNLVSRCGESTGTALMDAAGRGSDEMVRLLRPLEARLQDGRGWTALMHAVGRGHEECVGLLLLERDLKDREGRTAEDVANGLPKEMRDRMLKALRKPLNLLDLPPELGPLTITGLVGNDKTGIVYTACNRSHRNCLLRVVRYSSLPEKTRRAIGEEVRILPSLRHENVLSCLGVVDDPPQQTAYFVFPWHPKVLLEEIRDRREAGRSFGTDELWKCIRQIANGMQHLHEHDWFCRGLSPASIYLSKDGKCVLAPFELAQPLDAPLYLAPEIQRGSPHDPAADVWTLGAIIYEMCAGVPPFKSVDEISSGAVPRIGGRPGSLTDLVARMLSSSPESRPSIQECLRSVPRGSDPHPPRRRSEDRFMEALRSRGREAYEEAMSLFEDGLELSPEQETEACRLAIANGWSRMAEQFEEAYRPEEGRTTMLMCAAMDRNLDLLRRYVHERRRQDENGWTALMHATIRNHPDSVKELLDEADIKSTKEVTRKGRTFPAGTTAKDIAKRLQDEKLIRVFSKHNGRSGAGFRERTDRASEGVDNPLIEAAKNGRDRNVRKYLNEYGGKSDKDGWTALMYAADGGYHECVSLLVEKEVRLQNKDGWTALMFAAVRGDKDVFSLLLSEKGMQSERPVTRGGKFYPPRVSALIVASINDNEHLISHLFFYEHKLMDSDGHDYHWYLLNNKEHWRTEAPSIVVDFVSSIYIGAEAGDVDMVIKHKEEAGIMGKNGSTALMLAAENGHLEVVKLLAQEEARMVDNRGMTSLMRAARNGHVDVVRYLAPLEMHMRDKDEFTAYLHAFICDRGECLEILRDELTDAHDPLSTIEIVVQFESSDAGTSTPVPKTSLEEALERYDRDALISILNSKETIGFVQKHNVCMAAIDNDDLELALRLAPEYYSEATRKTMLMLVASTGASEYIRKYEYELGKRDGKGHTATMIAVQKRRPNIISVLQGREAMARDLNGWTALMLAASLNYCDCIEELRVEARLSTKKSVENPVFVPEGATALMIAVIYGHIEAVRILSEWERGMSDSVGHTAKWHAERLKPNSTRAEIIALLQNEESCSPTGLGGREVALDSDGNSLLMEKIQGHNYDEILRVLPHYIGRQNKHGWSALMFAVQKNRASLIRHLICEATIQTRNRFQGFPAQVTALMISAILGHRECVQHLSGVEARCSSITGRTALMYAAENGHTECVRILRDHERGMCTNEGETALILAARKGQDGPASLLLEEACMQDRKGYTALMYAAEKGHIETVRVLCELEAGVANSTDGFSALMYALINEHFDCAELLQSEAGMVTTKEVTYRGCVYPEGTSFSSLNQ